MRAGFAYRVAAGLLMMAAALTAAALAQDSVVIKMSLDRDRIGLNESAILSVSISCAGQKQLPEPKLPPLPQFALMPAGSATNLQAINGVTNFAQTYNYQLIPRQLGTFPIHAASAVVNGTRYESNALSVEVVQSSQRTTPSRQGGGEVASNSKDIMLTASVDKKNPYVGEQVTLTIKFFRAVTPLSNPDYSPPQMQGFWTTDIGPQKEYYQTVNGRDFLVTELRQALFPTAPGRYTVGEASVSVVVPEQGRRRNRDPFSLFDDMFQQGVRVRTASNPIAVEARPLPDEGKPAQYSGSVGTYKISAGVDKLDVEVNEAVNLSVLISGEGNIKSIPEPALPPLDGFRVEKSTSDFKQTSLDNRIGGTKTFEYVLIPRLSGRQTIGPLTLSYFDPSRRTYQTIATEPITLNVRQGELATGAEIPYNMVAGQTLDLKETDIRFIKTGGTHLYRKGRVLLTSPLFIVFLALPVAALAGGIIDVRRRRRLSEDIGYARLRRANAVAKKRLKKAGVLLAGGDEAAFHAEISGMVLQYIADKFNLSALGLTADRVDELLQQAAVADELRQETQAVLQKADFGRFAGAAGGAIPRDELFEQVRRVIVGLEEAL